MQSKRLADLPHTIFRLADIALPVVQASTSRRVNANPSATVHVRVTDFLSHQALTLSGEAQLIRRDEPIFTGYVVKVSRRGGILRFDLEGSFLLLQESHLAAGFAKFPVRELMYAILRDAGLPRDRIVGLPKDDELRWFDCIFQLDGISAQQQVSLEGASIYRLRSAADDHEEILLASAFGTKFKNRTVLRTKILANEWVAAFEKAADTTLNAVAWLDFVAAAPLANTAGGRLLIPWRRADMTVHPRLGNYHSLFDPKHRRLWVRKPNRQEWRLWRSGSQARRLGAMSQIHHAVARANPIQESIRWLHLARHAASTTEAILALWYALEFAVAGGQVPNVLNADEKRRVLEAVDSLVWLGGRQRDVLKAKISDVNTATFRARLNATAEESGLALSTSERTIITQARKFRNSVLHGGTANGSRELARDFDSVVRKVVSAVAETELSKADLGRGDTDQ